MFKFFFVSAAAGAEKLPKKRWRSTYRRIMHKNYNKFLQSVVVLPVLTMSFALNPVAGIAAKLPTAAVTTDQTRPLSTVLAVNQQQDTAAEVALDGAKVDAFFAQYKLPMEGDGQMLVQAAVDNNLPPYTIAALALNESTAGKFACPHDKYNVFGWNSCHGPKFDSMQDAVTTVAETISGNNPATASYYEDKSLDARLEEYNGLANSKYVSNFDWAVGKFDSMQVQPAVQLASL